MPLFENKTIDNGSEIGYIINDGRQQTKIKEEKMKWIFLALVAVFSTFAASPPYGPPSAWITCEYGKAYTFVTDSGNCPNKLINVDLAPVLARYFTWITMPKLGITITFPLTVTRGGPIDSIFDGNDHTLTISAVLHGVPHDFVWTFHTVKYVPPAKVERNIIGFKTKIDQTCYDILGRKISKQVSGRYLAKGRIVTVVK